MRYSIKSHPTTYAGVRFRSRLEARYAAFFDIVNWQWAYEPIDIVGWSPDFRVTFPCGHSECGGYHTLLAEIKPYTSIREFDGHPCMDYPYGTNRHGMDIPAESGAAFGENPGISCFEISHGAGGGVYDIAFFVIYGDVVTPWAQAGNIVQWTP